MQRYELHKYQISDDFVYWFRNSEDIFQAVFRKNSLKMSVIVKLCQGLRDHPGHSWTPKWGALVKKGPTGSLHVPNW